MTPSEQALVDAHDRERAVPKVVGRPRPPAFAAGWFVKHHGSARVALDVWVGVWRKMPWPTPDARAWAAEVERLLREATEQGEASASN